MKASFATPTLSDVCADRLHPGLPNGCVTAGEQFGNGHVRGLGKEDQRASVDTVSSAGATVNQANGAWGFPRQSEKLI